MPQSAKVREYMAASLVTFTPEMEIMDAIDALIRNRISGAPVVGTLDDLDAKIQDLGVDQVYVAMPLEAHAQAAADGCGNSRPTRSQ